MRRLVPGEDETLDKVSVLDEINKDSDGTIEGSEKARDVACTLCKK